MEDRLAELESEIAEFRRLAAEDPDHLYPGLAIALADFSMLLRDMERRGESVEAAREASDLFQVLARHDDQFRRHSALALNNLSARLQDLGLTTEALDAARSAVDAAAELPPDEDGNPLILAAARLNTATQLFILGGVREGTAVLCEVGRSIRRMLEAGEREAAGNQLAILQEFADQARERMDWGQHVGLRRALMLALPGDPAAGRAVLAYALDEAATAMAESDPDSALTWAEEAVGEFARLAGEDSARYSLAWQGAAERWLHLAGDDMEVSERAARALAAAAVPGSERHAVGLTMVAMALDGQARFDDALTAVEEALAAWRALPGDLRRLASCLNIRAGLLDRMGRLEEALDTAAEAVALWRAAETIDPATDAVVFADTLRMQAALLVKCRRWEAALAVVEEGTRLLLSAILQAGIGSSSALDALERLRGQCLAALGRQG